MKPFRSFVPPLAAMLLAASGGAVAQGILIDKSEIRFVSKQMGASVEGRFRRWKANVDFRPGDLAKSKANFEIELASIDLASEESEVETRRAVWFDTARFPLATFTSTSIRGLGADRYEIAGTLSIKGIAKDVVVPVALRKDAAGNTVAEGQFTLKRLEFKIGEGVWADTDAVANDIVVRVRMVLPPIAQ
jgi:polyisoprenoid-binding protein YceI